MMMLWQVASGSPTRLVPLTDVIWSPMLSFPERAAGPPFIMLARITVGRMEPQPDSTTTTPRISPLCFSSCSCREAAGGRHPAPDPWGPASAPRPQRGSGVPAPCPPCPPIPAARGVLLGSRPQTLTPAFALVQKSPPAPCQGPWLCRPCMRQEARALV